MNGLPTDDPTSASATPAGAPDPPAGGERFGVRSIRNRGLRRRFVIAISTLVALVVVIETAVLLYYGSRHLREEIEHRAGAYAELAAGPICQAYQAYSGTGLAKLKSIVIHTVGLDPDLRALAVYNTSGELLFHSNDLGQDARGSNLRYLDTGRLRAVEGPIGQEIRTWHDAGGRLFAVQAPYIEEWGSFRHAVVFYFSYEGLEAAIRSEAWRIIGLGAFALVLGVACAYLLSAQALVPVEKLTHGARQLAEGDLEHPIGLHTGDEFEVLGDTLDQMAQRLRTTIRDLEASNERLNRVNEELQELDRLKRDLLANVSHELRTPLTAISGYVEAMQEGLLGDLDAAQASSLAIIERNIRRLRSMIDQLLSYSRMESGQMTVELRAFDLEGLIDHVVEALRAIHGDELQLECHVQPDLPEAYGDSGRIAQVIENLLTNAIKFTPGAGLVEVRAEEAEGGVEVLVRDTGIGIPAEAQEKIFDRFYQIDASSRRKFGGMGLGLAIVREILELNHSEIRIESEVGKGSTFRFLLPLAAERTGLVPIQGRACVAIIDDDAGFVQSTAAHLSRRGFVVETAATAEQGYGLVRRVRPKVVLLDRLLPDCDGFDLLERLRQDPKTRTIPIALVTVRSEKALGLRLGASAYLIKPVDPETVERQVRALLGDEKGRPEDAGDAPAVVPGTRSADSRDSSRAG